MNSRRVIDCVMRGDNEEATRILRESLDRKQVEATLEQSVAIAYDAIHESDNAAAAADAAAEQGLPDPALDPAMTKEFFLKSFEVDGTPVTLKKLGLGASAPISSFVGGERWEMFMTPQQATREAKKYITSGQYKKDADARAAAIAAAEKEAEKEDKPSVKKESVELDENVQNQVKRMDKKDKQKLADKLNALDLSGYGDYEARVDNVHKFKPSDLKMAMQMMSLKEQAQFSNVIKKAEDMSKRMRKPITVMQHTSNGDYEFAGNRDEIRKLERKNYEIVDTVNEDVQLDEKIKGLENKSKKSGIAYGILKKVYDRGMEAWRSGHRPGATQHQWAFARVNSFITGGKTRTTADKDLWAQHKGNKKESVEEGLRQAMSGKRETDSQKQKRREKDNFDLYMKRQKRVAALRGDKSSRKLTPGQEKHYRQTAKLPEETQLHEATKSYKFKNFKTADAFAKACDEIVDSSDLTVNKKTNEVTVEFRRRTDEMIIDSLAKDYGA